MQKENEMLDMVGHNGITSSVATHELPPNGGADNPNVNEIPRNAEDKTEGEAVDEFDFSLPSKGKKQRKAKTRKQINIDEEAVDIPLDGKTRRRRKVSDVGVEGVSTNGTGKRKRHPSF